MIKLITGWGTEEKHTVSGEEAHKAYYLFLHPNERGIFSDGLAIVGKDIRRIEPDYHSVMGWNDTHKLDNDDMSEIKRCGVDKQIRDLMERAKKIAVAMKPEHLTFPMSKVEEHLKLGSGVESGTKQLSDKIRIKKL